ncbi:MAG: hypothetical protein AAGD96_01050 [Chloroflexota bacterium]
MYYLNDLDDRSRQVVEEEISRSGETLWWVGKPKPLGILRAKFSFFQLIFGVFFFGVVFFMLRQFLDTFNSFSNSSLFDRGGFGQFFPYFFLFILGFIIFNGLRSIFSPVWEAIGSFSTIYAITNNRAVIIKQLPRKSVMSYYPTDFEGIERTGNDDLGDVTFAKKTITVNNNQSHSKGGFSISFGGRNSSRGYTRIVRTGFIAVSQPREVEEILASLVESADR